jgi:DNA-binding GntR family transcriptional regulator
MSRRDQQKKPGVTESAPPVLSCEDAVSPSIEAMPDRFMRYIIDGIQTRRFMPGSRISERGVAKDLGISQVIAREYMERLVHYGWVERIAGQGILVRRFDRAEIESLFDFREILECGTVYRLAETINDEHLGRLKTNVDLLESLTLSLADEDVKLYKTTDIEFHKLLFAFVGNERVAEMFEAVIGQISFIIYNRGPSYVLDDLYRRRDPDAPAGVPHREIYRSLHAHDALRAEQVMRDHIRYARSMTLELSQLFGYG